MNIRLLPDPVGMTTIIFSPGCRRSVYSTAVRWKSDLYAAEGPYNVRRAFRILIGSSPALVSVIYSSVRTSIRISDIYIPNTEVIFSRLRFCVKGGCEDPILSNRLRPEACQREYDNIYNRWETIYRRRVIYIFGRTSCQRIIRHGVPAHSSLDTSRYICGWGLYNVSNPDG